MSSKDFFYGLDENPFPNGILKRMSIVGDITANTVKLWFRTGGIGKYTLLLYRIPPGKDEWFSGFSYYPFKSSLHHWEQRISFSIIDRNDDFTVVIKLENLDPNVHYGYALLSSDDSDNERILLGKKRKHTFRTLPQKLDSSFSFALYSCHMPYKVDNHFFDDPTTEVCNFNMWQFMRDAVSSHRARGLRFIIAGGDQVYCDGVKTIDLWKFLNKRITRKAGKVIYPSRQAMLSWYRSIYRGYWNFKPLQQIFSNTPIYMMWDDHELCDGFGSYQHDADNNDMGEYVDILPNLKEHDYTYNEGMQVIKDMEWAGKKAYYEYQHAHNPDIPGNHEIEIEEMQWDYSVDQGNTAFYFLDGRGKRDFMRSDYKIHGKKQFDRFESWINEMIADKSKKFLFVVAAVPVFHLKPYVAQLGSGFFGRLAGLQDDLRDSWEHDAHTDERDKFCELLFKAAARGKKVSILSGDVHIAAAYKVRKKETNAVIYQLTSSALTYNVSRIMGKVLGKIIMPEDGHIEGTDYTFERLMGPLPESNFSIIKVKPDEDKVIFQIYTEKYLKGDEDEQGTVTGARPFINSNSRAVLDFK